MMSLGAQRRALAEIAGFTRVRTVDTYHMCLQEYSQGIPPDEKHRIPLPLFESDLEHLSRVEEHAGLHNPDNTKLRVKWVGHLREVVGRRMPKNKVGSPILSDVDLLLAPASERTEALLLTFKKWDEVPT